MSSLTQGPFVRPARRGDEPFIEHCNLQLAWETEHKKLDPEVLRLGVAAAVADPGKLRYWVAERDAVLVGQAAVSTEWSDWRNGWIWWFQSVYVAPQERGRGVFRAIHNQIRSEALADRSVIGLRLYVEDANTRAQEAYRALGLNPGGYSVYEELWIDPRVRAALEERV